MPAGVPDDMLRLLQAGTVIPAHLLALTSERRLDERRQRALTRYYLDAGAGGLAVGVHTTQFALRDAGLLPPMLELAVEEAAAVAGHRPLALVAGVVGPTDHALREAEQARELGYHTALPSPGGLAHHSEAQLLDRTVRVAEIMHVFGFYLKSAVGGRVLSHAFWRDFADIPSVIAIKMAPFDRYATLDVVRAVCASSRRDDVALYTGNDDNIVTDLLALGVKLTDANAAVFAAANGFAGVIAGVHEVLRGQGLLAGTWCLDPGETLSPGQREEIDRVRSDYPELTDDAFVTERVAGWMAAASVRPGAATAPAEGA